MLVTHCHSGLGTLYGKIGRVEQACTELSTVMALYHAMETTSSCSMVRRRWRRQESS